jgi:hypothetical protein
VGQQYYGTQAALALIQLSRDERYARGFKALFSLDDNFSVLMKYGILKKPTAIETWARNKNNIRLKITF